MSHLSSLMHHPMGSHLESPAPLLFHSLVVTDPEHHPRRAATTALGSVVLHSLLIGAVAVIPLIFYDAIPDQDALRTFFVSPLEIQPPPPPPPAGTRRAVKAPPRPVEVQASGFIAPIEVPSEIRPEEGLDLGVPGGVAGGVEGGVPGGVVGGVVGGLPLSTQAPPPPAVAPVRVGGHIRAPVKIKDARPQYPKLAEAARVQGTVILECTISPRGTVTAVKVLRGIPLLDDAAIDAVRQWVYTPTLLNGVPVPVIMTVTVNFQLL